MRKEIIKRVTALCAILALTSLMIFSPTITLPQEKPPNWEVFFSPKGGATNAIIRELNGAKSTILVQAYSFTSAPIAKALLNAHKKGVKVEVILDKSQGTQKYSSATFLLNAGIPTKIDAAHAIAHNKVMVIDGEIVITGWASKHGPHTEKLITHILESRLHPQQGFRSCLGILRLVKSYSPERLEAACACALHIKGYSYKSVESILKTGLDRKNPLLDQIPELTKPILHLNIRGKQYYQ